MPTIIRIKPSDLFSHKLRVRKLLKNEDVLNMLKTAHLYGELKQSYKNIGQTDSEDYTYKALLEELGR